MSADLITSPALCQRLGITAMTLSRWRRAKRELRECRLSRGYWSVAKLEAAGYLHPQPAEVRP